MSRWVVALPIVIGCSGTPAREAEPPAQAPEAAPAVKGEPLPPVPPVAAPVAAVPPGPPDAAPAVGAMPVPHVDDEASAFFEKPPIEVRDTSIRTKELPDVKGSWGKRHELDRTGEVLLVMHVDRDKGEFFLSVVEDGTGIHEQFSLGKTADRVANPFDGSSFVPFTRDGETPGPILFATRIMLKGASQKRQYVVFSRDTSVFVIARQLGAQAWKRILRLDFAAGATFTAIGTTDPH